MINFRCSRPTVRIIVLALNNNKYKKLKEFMKTQYNEQIEAIEKKNDGEVSQQPSLITEIKTTALAAPSDSDLVFQYDDSGNQIRREVIKVS
ncbi:hypothetical protein SPPR111872_19030 [Sphingobacterium prati]